MSNIEAAKKIVEKKSCDGISCTSCPACNFEHVVGKSTFCHCFKSDAGAIRFFKKYILDNEVTK